MARYSVVAWKSPPDYPQEGMTVFLNALCSVMGDAQDAPCIFLGMRLGGKWITCEHGYEDIVVDGLEWAYLPDSVQDDQQQNLI